MADPKRAVSGESVSTAGNELQFTGRLCGGLIADLRRRGPYFVSDWTDAFKGANIQLTFSAIFFLFFVCLSPALAFGSLLSDATDGQIGVVETILATAMVGVFYSVVSGQPICIQGATGPELAYTVVFFQLCKSLELEFLVARVWQGLWCALITVLLAITDSCALMSHFTRFVEDIFAALISKIFIIGALRSIITAYQEKDNQAAFLTTLICGGTVIVCMQLRSLKESYFLNRFLRTALANFSAPIAIAVFTGLAQVWKNDVAIDWLKVPETFEPSWKNPTTGKVRSWFISPFGIDRDFPVWAIFATIVPALGLALLGYLDQNLTTIIINRPASCLRKPAGYHLDLFMCGIFVYPVCALLGLPFTHNSTGPSLIHLMALSNYETAASRSSEGDVNTSAGALTSTASRRTVAGVVEQRFSNFAIHLLIGACLGLAPLLKYVPKAVTFGIFLVMGWTSLPGNQLWERVQLWAIFDPKHYPRYNYVTRVKRSQMHLYTAIQATCCVVLYAMTEIKQVAVIFPFFMGSLVFVRKALSRVFTSKELAELDAREELPMDFEDLGDLEDVIAEREGAGNAAANDKDKDGAKSGAAVTADGANV